MKCWATWHPVITFLLKISTRHENKKLNKFMTPKIKRLLPTTTLRNVQWSAVIRICVLMLTYCTEGPAWSTMPLVLNRCHIALFSPVNTVRDLQIWWWKECGGLFPRTLQVLPHLVSIQHFFYFLWCLEEKMDIFHIVKVPKENLKWNLHGVLLKNSPWTFFGVIKVTTSTWSCKVLIEQLTSRSTGQDSPSSEF